MVSELATVSLEDCLYGVPISIPERNKWSFLYHASTALAYLESKKVLHLDVKPGNMLLFGEPECSEAGVCVLKLSLGCHLHLVPCWNFKLRILFCAMEVKE